MNKSCRVFCVLLILSISLLLIIEPCTAPVSMPVHPDGAPEIVSVTINSNHYWSPPQYTQVPPLDIPYPTHDTILASPGRYISNGTIVITIKNRPFTPYMDKNDNIINTYYKLHVKYPYQTSWSDIFEYHGPWCIIYQSDIDYTTITATYSPDVYSAPYPHLPSVYEGEQIIFLVQAVTGYFTIRGYDLYEIIADCDGVGSEYVEFEVTIPVTPGDPRPTTTTFMPSTYAPATPTTPPTPPPASTPPSYSYLLILATAVCIIAISATLTIHHNNQQPPQPQITNPFSP